MDRMLRRERERLRTKDAFEKEFGLVKEEGSGTVVALAVDLRLPSD